MRFKKKTIGILVGLLSFVGVAGASLLIGTGGNLSTGSLESGKVHDMPMTTGWLQNPTTTSDRSAAHNHGTVDGATVGATSTDFDGTADIIDMSGLVTTLADNTTGTVCLTGNIDTDDAAQNMPFGISRNADATLTRFIINWEMGNPGTGPDHADVLFIDDGTFEWRWGGASNELDVFVGADLRLCVVQDGVEPKFYFNGSENTSGSFSVTTDKTLWFDTLFSAASPADSVTLGAVRNNSTVTAAFDGQVNDLKIWDRPLSAAEILLDFETNDRSLATGSLFEQLVGWWPSASEWLQSATVFSDKTAARNHMTLTGTPPTAGAISVDYNGSSDYSTLAISDYRISDDEGGVMVWINHDTATDLGYIFSTADTASDTRYVFLSVNGDDVISLGQRDNDTGDILQGDTTIATDTWYQVVLTTEGAGTGYALYVNTVKQTLTATSGSDTGDWLSSSSARDNINIGSLLRTSNTGFFDGEIADLRVYSKELTQADVQLHFDQTCQTYSAC